MLHLHANLSLMQQLLMCLLLDVLLLLDGALLLLLLLLHAALCHLALHALLHDLTDGRALATRRVIGWKLRVDLNLVQHRLGCILKLFLQLRLIGYNRRLGCVLKLFLQLRMIGYNRRLSCILQLRLIDYRWLSGRVLLLLLLLLFCCIGQIDRIWLLVGD